MQSLANVYRKVLIPERKEIRDDSQDHTCFLPERMLQTAEEGRGPQQSMADLLS